MIARLIRVMLILFSCLAGSVYGQSETVKIIVNTDVATTELTTTQLRRIFSMRQSVWPDGSKLVVYVLNSEHPTHELLCKDVLKMFPYQMDKLWNKLAFSGVSDTPIQVQNEAEMIARVQTTPGAIGYTLRPIDNMRLHVVNILGAQ